MRFLILLLVTVSAWGQTGTISGEVIFDNNELAAGAAINVMGTQKYVIADADGRFEITGLAYGDYVLQISSLEAKTKTADIKLATASVHVMFTLEKTDVQVLEEAIVTKTSAKRELLDKGFALNIIETEQAALRNLQTNDLLDRTVGVRIRQNGGLGSSVDYNLNGMSGNSVKVFIDGIPISVYGPSFNLNSIPPALIERIEVYKGVVPAYLSDDALGGAINVVLKKGAKNMLNASVSYGSFNTVQSNLSAAYRRDSGFTVNASAFQNYSDNDYEVWGKFVYNILPNGRYDYIRAKRFNNMYRSYGGKLEAGYTDVKWADVFLIGYNGSQDFNEIQHGQYMTKPYKGRFSEANAHVLSLNYARKDFIAKGLDFSFNGVYSERSEVVNDTVKWNYNWDGNMAIGLYGDPILTPAGAQQGAPTINNITRNIITVRSSLNYSFNQNHRILFNTMFNRVDRDDYDELKSNLERTFQETRDLKKTISSLAYEMQAFKSRLRANIFGKYYVQKIEQRDPVLVTQNGESTVIEEIIANTTTTLGYGMATSYFLSPKVMFLSSAEKAVRMPSENEVFGSPGENVIGNATINPEISNNLNLGLRVGPYTIHDHKITVSASAFWRNTKDKIVRTTSSRINDAIQTLPFENLGKTQSLGFEASLDYVYDNRLFLSANMSKFNSLFKKQFDSNGNTLPYYNKQLPNEPYLTINANAQYNFKNLIQNDSQVNLYYNCGYVDPFYTLWIDLDSFSTPAQFVQDFGFSYMFPKKQVVVSFDARNIFDKQVFDNYAVQKPGRAFYIKLNYTINNFNNKTN